MNFNTNLKFLRQRKNRTQDVVANALEMSRSRLNSYEQGIVVNPTMEALLQFSKYYKISIDTFIRVDLSKLSESKLLELELGHDDYIKGTKLRILATTVDSNNRDNIELVPVKAKAGYTAGYNDPEYISSLPTFQLPFLAPDRKYRTFQISGDSMLPIPDKSYITAEFVDNWMNVKDGNAYILLTEDDGVVFKVVYNQLRSKKKFLLKSLNTTYEPYELNLNEVREIWKFINYISHELPQPEGNKDELINTVAQLQKEVSKISSSLRKRSVMK